MIIQNRTGRTTLRLFESTTSSPGTFTVAAGSVASQGLSFIGASFEAGKIHRVRITSGSARPGAGVTARPGKDLRAMDDFICGGPIASPALSRSPEIF
jgi:hypothetical protein